MINPDWLPPPDLSISQWADQFRVIPSEASSEPGHWNTDRAPYQRALMDAVNSCERVIIMTAAQIGKTELVLNTIGYFVDREPCPILVLNPTIEMAETFSKDRLAPMIRDTPCLAAKIADPKSRSSGNTIKEKLFPGGQITLAGANSPASLASRPIRVLLCDEVDRYPLSAGIEGDPLTLAMKRTQNFFNRKIILVSTPTIKGISRIHKEFELSTQEEFFVPCPRCSELVSYEWEYFFYEGLHEPVMQCPHCKQKFIRRDWHKMNHLGKWIPKNPGALSRGFHVSAFVSPWADWAGLCRQYDEAQHFGSEALKVWHNTVLGLPYEFDLSRTDAAALMARTELYGCDVPDGVMYLTAGVDVQDDRLELEIVGWGVNNVSWGILYMIIHGDPGGNVLWAQLDDVLARSFTKQDGSAMHIACACIDSGGHFTDNVYKFVKPRHKRNIFAIIGRGTWGLPAASKPSRNNRANVPLITLGVTGLKNILFARLNADEGAGGYCHFPSDDGKGYTQKYFQGLYSEEQEIVRVNGIERVKWVKRPSVRNEPLDCRVYAMGAFAILNPKFERKQPVKRSAGKKLLLKRGLRL